jgi:uncharacterized protein YjbI with pentapeptide repeats
MKFYSTDDLLEILKQGVPHWNSWRNENPNINNLTFRNADISFEVLIYPHDFEPDENTPSTDEEYPVFLDSGVSNLPEINFDNVAFVNTNFNGAHLENASFKNTVFYGCSFNKTNLQNTNFEGSQILHSSFLNANLAGSCLKGSKLLGSSFIESDLSNANLDNSNVYGISAWDINLVNTSQKDLKINSEDTPEITLDNLEIAQFIFLLLQREKLRDVINVMTSKCVLILGRFSEERMPILDLIKTELRQQNYLPIIFDFPKPASRSFSSTVSLLANLAKFVIVDLTNPKSTPHELAQIIPNNPNLPIAPILETGQETYELFNDFKKYPWVLSIINYSSTSDINEKFVSKIISEVAKKLSELSNR